MVGTFYRVRSGNRDFYNQDYSGVIQLVVPEETINLITNPSIEIDTTGFQAYNSGLTRDITYQNRGKYSLKVTPNTCASGSFSGVTTWVGALYPVDLITGTPYTFSVDVKGQAGVSFLVFFWDSTYTYILGQRTYFVADGNWQRAWANYNEVASLSRYVAVFELINSGSMCSPFYIDGLQLEAKIYPTTYCDGDVVSYTAGVKEYLWNGAPHASTSTRLGSTTSGGKIINLFKDTNAKFINTIGLGLPPINPIQNLTAYGESGFYQRSNQAGRTFSITCDISRINTIDKRKEDLNLVNLVSPKRVSAPQPLLFRFLDDAFQQKNVTGNVGKVRALYASGLEGDKSNPYIERLILNFASIEPYKTMDGDRAAELPLVSSTTGVNRVMRRDKDGNWAILGAGVNNGFDDLVRVIKRAPDGKIFFGGDFHNCNGAAALHAAYWDGTSFTQLGSGVIVGFNAAVYDFEFDNNGNVYVVGAFTKDGDASDNLNYVAKYVIATNTLSNMGVGYDAAVYCVKFSTDGLLYTGGAFTVPGKHVAVYYPETSTWGDIGDTNIVGNVHSIVFGAMDRMYIGGVYPLVTVGGESSGVAYTNVLGIYGVPITTIWNLCGNSGDSTHIQSVYAMTVDAEGNVYAAETPNTPASTTAYVKKYLPGGAWENIGYAFYNAANVSLTGLIYEKYSKTKFGLIVSGVFTSVDNIPNYGGFAKFVGNKWCPLDVDIRAVGVSVDGRTAYVHNGEIILSFISSSTVIVPVPSTTPIVITGSGSSNARFTVSGVGILRSIINITTGDELLFRDLSLVEGEILNIDFSDPNNISLYSNVSGDISGRVHPGSDVGSFKLIKGNNYLSSFFYVPQFLLGGMTADNVIVEWNDAELDILGVISRHCPRISPIKGSYPPAPAVGTFYILMEDGFFILLETLDKIVME